VLTTTVTLLLVLIEFLFVKKWNGQFFETVTLKSLGLRIQLGHPTGQCCPTPQRAFNDDFVVLDVYGIHEHQEKRFLLY